MTLETRPLHFTGNDAQPPPDWGRRLYLPASILAWSIVILGLFWLAGHIVTTLILIAVAVLIAYALAPSVSALQRRAHLPRLLAVTIVYLIFLGLFGVLVWIIVDAFRSEFPTLVNFVKGIQSGHSPLNSYLQRVGIKPSTISGLLSGAGSGLLSQARGALTAVVPLVGSLFSAGVDVIVILVLSIYFLANGPRVGHFLRHHTPTTQQERIGFFLDTLDRVVGGYIRGQTILSALIGLLVGLGMGLIFHLPLAALLGILAFVLEYIPFIGVFMSGLACVLVALSQGLLIAVGVLAYFVVIHVIEGDVVGPRIVGWAVGLHPAVSLIALIAGFELFGLWGALFASPVAGFIQTLVATFWYEYQRIHPERFSQEAVGHVPKEALRHSKFLRNGVFRGVFFRRRPPSDSPPDGRSDGRT